MLLRRSKIFLFFPTGGATIEAIDILERSGLRTAMMQAVEAATNKCKAMAKAVARGGQ